MVLITNAQSLSLYSHVDVAIVTRRFYFHAQTQRWGQGVLTRSPGKSQSYQARIQCWAIIGPPAKRHLNGYLNGVSLVGQ